MITTIDNGGRCLILIGPEQHSAYTLMGDVPPGEDDPPPAAPARQRRANRSPPPPPPPPPPCWVSKKAA